MNPTAEHWLPIPGYEGRYDVSDQGRVRSLLGNGGRPIPYLMTPCADSKGYMTVTLSRARNTAASQLVHLLVLLAFTGPKPSGYTDRRHIDGDCRNNAHANLAYGTRSQNMRDRVEHGTDPNSRKTHCPSGHAYSEENTYRRSNGRHRYCRACERARRAIRSSKNQ